MIEVYGIFCKEFCLIIVLPLSSKSETLDPGKGYDELHLAQLNLSKGDPPV
jgi:hypothetical protein